MSGRNLILVVFLFLFLGFLYGQTETAGPLTKEEILQKCPDWRLLIAAYKPKPEIIDRLKAFPKEIRTEIFLGTWCPDSKDHVSEYLKIMELVDNPLFQTTYIAIPKDKTQRAAFYEGRDIQRLPTFIVKMDGREVGRIVEAPEKSMEEDLLDIIEKFL